LNGKTIVGDLNKSSIKEIFYNERRKWMIKKMFLNKRQEIGCCSKCPI
jgi:hypothetical protein